MNPVNPDQKQGFYPILNGDKKVVIHNVKMAPSSGVFAQNYSRAIHSEKQPHELAASWTTYRSGGQAAGAHFVLEKYRIKVEEAANTLVVWRPQDKHGTTLPEIHPNDDELTLQLGLAIVTSSQLMGV
ncbi:hypothetical protein CERSUDRAFT_53909 [Gelatoporia subvermispora B]|uniref:Uncharacterized protein n=1 Tax=Ceriporiopsis subvermispora (strain B) TaxID=914234 RepID=M2QDX2_CERS8|nr:hypothetical protein CERSUDRAFT_53909 [Gelatoporia subvermispora B]